MIHIISFYQIVHPTGYFSNHDITKSIPIEQPGLHDAKNVPMKSNLHEEGVDLETDYWTMARILIDFYRGTEGLEEVE
jgi:hypothetical protein